MSSIRTGFLVRPLARRQVQTPMELLDVVPARGQRAIEFKRVPFAYSVFEIIFANLVSSVNLEDLFLQISSNGGGSFFSTNEYTHVRIGNGSVTPTTLTGAGAAGTNGITVAAGVGNAANQSASGNISGRRNASDYPTFDFSSIWVDNAGNTARANGNGISSQPRFDALRLIWTTGTMSSGRVWLYGGKNAF